MDYRCPICRKDLATRKLLHSVVARWEIECRFCGRRIKLNVHPAERALVLVGFGAFLALAISAWILGSRSLTLLALCAGVAAAVAPQVLEKTALRSWARYVPAEHQP